MRRRKPQNRKPPRSSATLRNARNATAHFAKTAGPIAAIANEHTGSPNLAGAALSATAYLIERTGALADRSRKRKEGHAGRCGELEKGGGTCSRIVKAGGPSWQH